MTQRHVAVRSGRFSPFWLGRHGLALMLRQDGFLAMVLRVLFP
jgi:hypothetical protein